MATERNSREAEEMIARNEMHVSYNAFARWVHWLTLLLMVCLFALAWSIDDLPKDWGYVAVQTHKSFGITVLVLTVARLAWRLAAGVPALPADLPAWQRAAARLNEYALYLLLLAQPTVGWLWSSAGTKPINFFSSCRCPG